MRAGLNPGQLGGLLGLLFLASCGRGDNSTEPAIPSLAGVVAERLANLTAADTEAPVPTTERMELTQELLQTRVHGGEFRDLAFKDLATLGKAAVLPLAQWARDGSLDNALRQAAVELLGVLAQEPSGAAASERLLDLTTTATEPWLRAHAAWRLGTSHSDHVLPRLVLRLNYESDPEAFLWVASSLARGGCLAGLGGLMDLASRGDERATRAQAEITWIEEQLADSAAKLLQRWSSSEASALPLAAPSEAQLSEIWSLVQDLSGDTFALRPVDDARYILSHLGPWCARELAAALWDTDPYVRLHVAQVLERMGPRARETEMALVVALTEVQVAPAVAEALGSVGSPRSLKPLLAASQADQPHELRVAAVRGLGDLGLPGALDTIQELFRELKDPSQEHLQDLRLASAKALVQLGSGDEASTWLLQQMEHGPGNSDAEQAIGLWLTKGTAGGRLGFEAALRHWQAQSDPPGSIPSAERARSRRTARGQQLSQVLDSLIAP
ncbi:MAG: hypothetical protein CMJ86_02830 [Planctomycetes bacterium]|nr:hypothetical protein [Planctomycetota bacterium]